LRQNNENATDYCASTLGLLYRGPQRRGTLLGGADAETGQATCYGRANKKDGSFIQIHRSLVDGEVWAIVHDTEWEIQGPDRGSLRWNFFNGLKNGLIAGANFDYNLKDKNTILILQIEPKKFSEALWNARYFTLARQLPWRVSLGRNVGGKFIPDLIA
jgi:hypothetical protein